MKTKDGGESSVIIKLFKEHCVESATVAMVQPLCSGQQVRHSNPNCTKLQLILKKEKKKVLIILSSNYL